MKTKLFELYGSGYRSIDKMINDWLEREGFVITSISYHYGYNSSLEKRTDTALVVYHRPI